MAKEGLLAKIKELDYTEEMNPQSQSDRDIQIQVREEFSRKSIQEEIKWKQRSQDKWSIEGVKNAKHFHAVASGHRRINRIRAIESRGTIWEAKREVEREIANFYQKLYCSDARVRPKSGGNILFFPSHVQSTFVGSAFSLEEIKEDMDGMSGDSAPMPDGFPNAFFQQFWNDVMDDLHLLFQDFFLIGKFPMAMGTSFVALSPKKAGALSIHDFHPISLTSSIYKILAKVLVNRLRKVLVIFFQLSKGILLMEG